MKNVIKTIILILLIFIIFSIGILVFSNLKQNNEQYESNIINEKNSQTLQIDNTKITNLTERSRDNSGAMTKIKNVSNLNLSKIVLSFCMLAGRLEIYPMLILFSPSLWKKRY